MYSFMNQDKKQVFLPEFKYIKSIIILIFNI